eukprot:gnl/Dysnectes_brevis/1416_a1600_2772.p1 GENE.gnl/Dysnectes_brevis/1416_a1600_2772~~gnl/Dysnectes_brevis/1416_a1600_2772.p1  ORF type:complete len:179 (-),score=25.96 gnl/Dysnectes_brevis/1416_a1600_2772:48-584(-)
MDHDMEEMDHDYAEKAEPLQLPPGFEARKAEPLTPIEVEHILHNMEGHKSPTINALENFFVELRESAVMGHGSVTLQSAYKHWVEVIQPSHKRDDQLSLRTIDMVALMTLRPKDFQELIHHFPAIEDHLQDEAKRRFPQTDDHDSCLKAREAFLENKKENVNAVCQSFLEWANIEGKM